MSHERQSSYCRDPFKKSKSSGSKKETYFLRVTTQSKDFPCNKRGEKWPYERKIRKTFSSRSVFKVETDAEELSGTEA